jgi:hypothetical protein
MKDVAHGKRGDSEHATPAALNGCAHAPVSLCPSPRSLAGPTPIGTVGRPDPALNAVRLVYLGERRVGPPY